MNKDYPFVYKWTELSTGKWYIGSRTAKECHPNDGYICSSKIVKPLIKENSINWYRQILFMGSKIACVEYESALLKQLDAKHNSLSYNMHNGDSKFIATNRPSGRKGNTYGKKGIKLGPNGRKGIPTNIPSWNKGLTKDTDERVKNNPTTRFKGKTHTEETKLKQSIALLGRVSPRKGISMSAEQKEKIRLTSKGKPKSEETKQRMKLAQQKRFAK